MNYRGNLYLNQKYQRLKQTIAINGMQHFVVIKYS